MGSPTIKRRTEPVFKCPSPSAISLYSSPPNSRTLFRLKAMLKAVVQLNAPVKLSLSIDNSYP